MYSTFDGDVSFGDSNKLYLGASNDLQIYHNGKKLINKLINM